MACMDNTETGQSYVVDRFEDEWAVLEVAAGETFSVPKAWLPTGAEEGDVLHVSLENDAGKSSARFAIDPVATEERRQSAEALREGLPKGPEGDVEL